MASFISFRRNLLDARRPFSINDAYSTGTESRNNDIDLAAKLIRFEPSKRGRSQINRIILPYNKSNKITLNLRQE